MNKNKKEEEEELREESKYWRGITCSKCGTLNSPDAGRCSGCGSSIY